jgi:hypothetical protein
MVFKLMMQMLNTFKLVAGQISVLVCIIVLAACGDDGEVNPEKNEVLGEFMNCRITLMERENFSDDIYTYNNDSKLIAFDGGSATYEYSYAGKITTIKYYSYGELQRTETVTNNDAGFATQIKAVYENGITPTRFTDFEYDGNNQLVKKTVKDEGDTDEDHTVYQWFEGNMVAETDMDDDDVTTYTYTSDLTQPAEWFSVINLERGYVTIRNKNRVSKITNPNGTTFTHSYNEDDTGRIEAVTISPSNNDPYTKEYSYECD